MKTPDPRFEQMFPVPEYVKFSPETGHYIAENFTHISTANIYDGGWQVWQARGEVRDAEPVANRAEIIEECAKIAITAPNTPGDDSEKRLRCSDELISTFEGRPHAMFGYVQKNAELFIAERIYNSIRALNPNPVAGEPAKENFAQD